MAIVIARLDGRRRLAEATATAKVMVAEEMAATAGMAMAVATVHSSRAAAWRCRRQ